MNNDLAKHIKSILAHFSEIELAILYGSAVSGTLRPDSDLDIGVAGPSLLTAESKSRLIEALALETGRPVDLIDLQTTYGTLLHQILTKGKVIYCTNHTLYAELIKRMLFNQSDMMPYYYRILEERRKKWINN